MRSAKQYPMWNTKKRIFKTFSAHDDDSSSTTVVEAEATVHDEPKVSENEICLY